MGLKNRLWETGRTARVNNPSSIISFLSVVLGCGHVGVSNENTWLVVFCSLRDLLKAKFGKLDLKLLRHTFEVVIYEQIQTICNLKQVHVSFLRYPC